MSSLLKNLPDYFTITCLPENINWSAAMWVLINADLTVDDTRSLVVDLATVRDYIAEQEAADNGVLKMPKFEGTGDIHMLFPSHREEDGTMKYHAPIAVIEAVLRLVEVKALGPAGITATHDDIGMRMAMRMMAEDNGFTFTG